jgi:hypothetical protein
MANKWPITSGNWSDPLIWNGGTKPVPGDNVFANSQSLYIDENVTVSTLRNAASASAILSSGSFYLTDGVTVNLTAANAFLATVTPLIIISGSNSARINGNSTGTGITGQIIQMAGSSTLTMSSSFVGGSVAGSIIHNSSGSLILTGSYIPNGAGLGLHLIYMWNSGSLYLTGSLSGAGGTSYGIYKTAGSGSIYIIGNVTAGANGAAIIKQTSFGDIDVTGNVLASAGATSINNSAGGTIRVNGNIVGGAAFFNGILNTGANVLMTVTGSVIGAGNIAYGINNSGANSTMIISGSVNGGTSTAAGISIGSNVTLTVTGSVAGSNTADAIITTTATTIRITGSATAGIGGSAISATAAGIIEIKGPVSSSTAFPGVESTSTTATNAFTGPFYNVNNRNAVHAPNIQLISGSTPTWTFDTETFGEQRTLYTQNYPGNFPATTNVRQGIAFGDTSQFTGIVAIPSTGSVLRGVPVDNVTGSASFTTQNVWSTPTSSLTASNSLGARLSNTATVASDGILIALTGSL